MAPVATAAIQQVLHGYKDGHRILSASMQLSPEGARQMLILSDLAGPGFVEQFDGYLSGYPLLEDNLYALSRTWYAPEMARPGCVFTHTLLIDFADLAALPELRRLVARLRRPTSPADFSSYQETIKIELTEEEPPGQSLDSSDVAGLLASIYGAPDRSVFCRTDSAARYEALLIALFAQQWPRLRRSFSFCGGTTAARFVGSRPFDVVCIPTQMSRQAGRELPDAVWVQPESAEPLWCKTLIADLQRDKEPELRRFLWTYGADVQRPRAAMVPLVEAYLARHQTIRVSLAQEVQRIATAFPSPKEALRLKRDLLLQSNNISLRQRLQELATSSAASAFVALSSQLEETVKQLFEEQRSAGLELLIDLLRSEPNALGQALCSQALKLLSHEDLIQIKEKDPSLVAALARHVPLLIIQSALLQGSSDYQRELVTALSQSQQYLDQPELVQLLSFLPSPSLSVATAFISGFGQRSLDALLAWWKRESHSTEALRVWREVLYAEPILVLQHLDRESSPPAPWLCWLITTLDPFSEPVQSRPLLWAKDALSRIDFYANAEGTAAAIVLFAVALSHPDQTAAEVASGAFAAVHEAAERYNLPAEVELSWQRLQRILPSLGPWRDWDRCERLRRGFVAPFLYGTFDMYWFLQGLQDPWLLRKVIESCLRSDGGERFLHNLKIRIAQEDWHLREEQRLVLKKELRGI